MLALNQAVHDPCVRAGGGEHRRARSQAPAGERDPGASSRSARRSSNARCSSSATHSELNSSIPAACRTIFRSTAPRRRRRSRSPRSTPIAPITRSATSTSSRSDAEGHDLKVLEGGAGKFATRAIGAAQFEYGGANIDSRDLLKDFFAFFQDLRYDLYKLRPDGLDADGALRPALGKTSPTRTGSPSAAAEQPLPARRGDGAHQYDKKPPSPGRVTPVM
ncbi:MAG: hypothetical protein WDO24_12925 [Pseudomonadota bacterium]